MISHMRDPVELPIDVYVPGDPRDDPREPSESPPGITVHRGPPLHPDDLDVVDGIPVTSFARTLVDMAAVCTRKELCEMFALVRDQGRLDLAAINASIERVEWRPSLPMLHEVLNEFR
jgi:hypothetical protein